MKGYTDTGFGIHSWASGVNKLSINGVLMHDDDSGYASCVKNSH